MSSSGRRDIIGGGAGSNCPLKSDQTIHETHRFNQSVWDTYVKNGTELELSLGSNPPTIYVSFEGDRVGIIRNYTIYSCISSGVRYKCTVTRKKQYQARLERI